jgi:hypothetical protein
MKFFNSLILFMLLQVFAFGACDFPQDLGMYDVQVCKSDGDYKTSKGKSIHSKVRYYFMNTELGELPNQINYGDGQGWQNMPPNWNGFKEIIYSSPGTKEVKLRIQDIFGEYEYLGDFEIEIKGQSLLVANA